MGSSTTVVEVTSEETHVNTDQATIQGVLTGDQIDNLPVNGRNFLDLAQLEPGVQIQDGSTFDPTKNGYSSVSFGGRFGRAARIEVDGVDISDENVGTTTQNIPQSAIAEFQVRRIVTRSEHGDQRNWRHQRGHALRNQFNSRRRILRLPQRPTRRAFCAGSSAFLAQAVWRAIGRTNHQGQIVLLRRLGTHPAGRGRPGHFGSAVYLAHRQLRLTLPG